MIIERARLTIKPEFGAEFETILAQARAIFLRSRGCAGVHFERVVETPEILRRPQRSSIWRCAE